MHAVPQQLPTLARKTMLSNNLESYMLARQLCKLDLQHLRERCYPADGRARGCAGGGEVRSGDRACWRLGHACSPPGAAVTSRPVSMKGGAFEEPIAVEDVNEQPFSTCAGGACGLPCHACDVPGAALEIASHKHLKWHHHWINIMGSWQHGHTQNLPSTSYRAPERQLDSCFWEAR